VLPLPRTSPYVWRWQYSRRRWRRSAVATVGRLGPEDHRRERHVLRGAAHELPDPRGRGRLLGRCAQWEILQLHRFVVAGVTGCIPFCRSDVSVPAHPPFGRRRTVNSGRRRPPPLGFGSPKGGNDGTIDVVDDRVLRKAPRRALPLAERPELRRGDGEVHPIALARGLVASAERYPRRASSWSARLAKAASTAAPGAPSRTSALSIAWVMAVASLSLSPPQRHERPASTRRATSASAASTMAVTGATAARSGSSGAEREQRRGVGPREGPVLEVRDEDGAAQRGLGAGGGGVIGAAGFVGGAQRDLAAVTARSWLGRSCRW
jgi:hypothetical protein